MFVLLSIISAAWAQEIRDVKPPVAYPGSMLLWLALLLILAAAAGIVLVRFYRNWKKNSEARREPEIPCWDLALKRLRRLESDDLASKGMIKEFFSRLSDIIRRYIEDRFGVRAPEMTTEEFLSSAGKTKSLGGHDEALKNFLNCCDMVKFAKYGSNIQEMEQSFVLARRFIEETKVKENSGSPS